jgi:glycerol-3-phosphate acyltransferase PlsY
MPGLVWVAVAYLLGSIPAALLAGKWIRGIDLRQYGSGNLGATNVYRVLGMQAAFVVFTFDLMKGSLPVLFFPRWTTGAWWPYWPMLYGVAAIAGHVRPLYLGGKGGGKGVATATGVFLALAPVPVLFGAVQWVTICWLTRYVSLASVFAACALPFSVAIWYGTNSPLVPGAVIVALFVLWTHRANLKRLREGAEPHIGGRLAP